MANCPHCNAPLQTVEESEVRLTNRKKITIYACPLCHTAISARPDIEEYLEEALKKWTRELMNEMARHR